MAVKSLRKLLPSGPGAGPTGGPLPRSARESPLPGLRPRRPLPRRTGKRGNPTSSDASLPASPVPGPWESAPCPPTATPAPSARAPEPSTHGGAPLPHPLAELPESLPLLAPSLPLLQLPLDAFLHMAWRPHPNGIRARATRSTPRSGGRARRASPPIRTGNTAAMKASPRCWRTLGTVNTLGHRSVAALQAPGRRTKPGVPHSSACDIRRYLDLCLAAAAACSCSSGGPPGTGSACASAMPAASEGACEAAGMPCCARP